MITTVGRYKWLRIDGESFKVVAEDFLTGVYMSVDAKVMTVVGAIRQSLQMSGGPGSSVNSHPNPFFLNVTGEINLKHMAELVIARVEEYEAILKAKTLKTVDEAIADFKSI